jgi:hypothetical protein
MRVTYYCCDDRQNPPIRLRHTAFGCQAVAQPGFHARHLPSNVPSPTTSTARRHGSMTSLRRSGG